MMKMRKQNWLTLIFLVVILWRVLIRLAWGWHF